MITNLGNVYSQDISDSLLTEFFNQTFQDYFHKEMVYYPKNDNSVIDFYIQNDSIPENVRTDYGRFRLHLVGRSQAYSLIEKNKIFSLYWTKSKHISKDTIEIEIEGGVTFFKRTFKIRKFDGKRKLITKEYYFEVSLYDGDIGYAQNGRFIYDAELEKWKYFMEGRDGKIKSK